jgi:hypothetical protein
LFKTQPVIEHNLGQVPSRLRLSQSHNLISVQVALPSRSMTSKWKISKRHHYQIFIHQHTTSYYDIIMKSQSGSWATCWPVPTSSIHSSLQMCNSVPSSTWFVVF